MMIRTRSRRQSTEGSTIRTDPGQATTEYALVLIGAAVIALLVVAWATDGGGAGRIGELFDNVLSNVLSRSETFEE
jgi:hypothetical protein